MADLQQRVDDRCNAIRSKLNDYNLNLAPKERSLGHLVIVRNIKVF